MVRYICGACGRRWTGHGRKPGGEVFCPKCGKLVYTYAKAAKLREPDKDKLAVRLDEDPR